MSQEYKVRVIAQVMSETIVRDDNGLTNQQIVDHVGGVFSTNMKRLGCELHGLLVLADPISSLPEPVPTMPSQSDGVPPLPED